MYHFGMEGPLLQSLFIQQLRRPHQEDIRWSFSGTAEASHSARLCRFSHVHVALFGYYRVLFSVQVIAWLQRIRFRPPLWTPGILSASLPAQEIS